MPIKLNVAQLRSRLADDLEACAFELLPPDSLARHAYENRRYPELRRARSAADSDKAECEQWKLTPEEWAEAMGAARIALAHDMKLDLIRWGLTPSI